MQMRTLPSSAEKLIRRPLVVFLFYNDDMKKHFVYLPGLGDGFFNKLRRAMLIGWRLRGLDVSFVELNWGDQDELAEAKYRRALEHIAKYRDRKVTLIGESAGGSMALRLFLEPNSKVDNVITVCGYNSGAEYVDTSHQEVHPAFIPTVKKVDRLLNNIDSSKAQSITTYYSPSDEVVGFKRTKIANAKAVKLPPLLHVGAIGYFLIRTSIKGLG